MSVYVILILALGPAFGIVLLIYYLDKYEKEPLWLVGATIGISVLFTILAVVYEHFILPDRFITDGSVIMGSDYGENFLTIFYGIGFPEELVKFLAVFVFAYFRKEFNEHFDGIVYAVVSAMGFAGLENIFYIISGGSFPGTAILIGILRAVTAIPAHALFGVIIGYFLGLARFAKTNGGGKFVIIITGLAIAMVFHTLYDFFAFYQMVPFLVIELLLLLGIGIILIIHARKRSPFKDRQFIRQPGAAYGTGQVYGQQPPNQPYHNNMHPDRYNNNYPYNRPVQNNPLQNNSYHSENANPYQRDFRQQPNNYARPLYPNKPEQRDYTQYNRRDFNNYHQPASSQRENNYYHAGNMPVGNQQNRPQVQQSGTSTSTILIMGIISLAACQLLGPVVWYMANKEIKSNPASRNNSEVTTGRILGIVSTVLIIISVLIFVIIFGIVGTSGF